MKKTTILFVTIFSATLLFGFNCFAQPYGSSIYNVNLPYGDETSLSIATDGDINISVTPTSEGVLSTSKSQVTVTSTDVAGYKLYIRALNSTNMDNLGSTLSSSENLSLAPLLVNTWGYNTDSSNNFLGISLNDTLIRSVSEPTPSGSLTEITYGIKVDMDKPAGKYSATVVYTAVPQTN